MDIKAKKQESIEFARRHLQECAGELLTWQDTGTLPDGKMRELARMCAAWTDESNALSIAEHTVQREALQHSRDKASIEMRRFGAKLEQIAAGPFSAARDLVHAADLEGAAGALYDHLERTGALDASEHTSYLAFRLRRDLAQAGGQQDSVTYWQGRIDALAGDRADHADRPGHG